jgi:multimeric flavodoxin WrbA
MFVLGLQGSPRKKGNTTHLLSLFMEEIGKAGALTETIDVPRTDITPCRGCGYCEKKGRCVIDTDEMANRIYPLLRRADLIVAASPIYFYTMSAQLKGLVDRCQSLWSVKYSLKLRDPHAGSRRGFLLSVGGSKGKNLFSAIELSTKYFFDALDATYACSLCFRNVDQKGDMQKHPTVIEDVKRAVTEQMEPFTGRKRIVFACRENACRSQMAMGFAAHLAADRIQVACGGSEPANRINPEMVKAMAEKGLDMQFRRPRDLEDVVAEARPDVLVTMGCGEKCPILPGTRMIDWDLPDPAGQSPEFMRDVRDEIEKRVNGLIQDLV